MVVAPLAANAACFTQSEWQAAHVQMLQRTLQVAALECANVPGHDYTAQYNTFVERFSDRLRADGAIFRAHFHRVYGRGADNAMDNYVTKMANDISADSMNSVTYCANPATAKMFTAALAIEHSQFEQAALSSVNDAEIGTLCPAHVVKAVAHKKKRVHKKTVKKVAEAG